MGRRSDDARAASVPAQARAASITLGWRTALVANGCVLLLLAYVAAVHAYDHDLYYAIVQEDEYLEWGTFWAFFLAAIVNGATAYRSWRSGGRLPWWLCGVGLFCFFVAMEEISWGQRVFGYRPPVYFLENNFQQELNIHNVFSTDVRMLTLKLVIALYGVVIPLAAAVAPIGRALGALGLRASPLALAPSFVAAYALYDLYPWSYSGETVELLLGMGFLLAAIAWLRVDDATARWESDRAMAWRSAVACALAMVLGLGNAAWARTQRAGAPELLARADVELRALKADFQAMAPDIARGRLVTRCDLHKRVYTYQVKYGRRALLSGDFAALTEQGMPEERAEFFLDPWNDPYWIRDRCGDDGARVVFVYSFGPNRRRESSETEILGDDLGALIFVRGEAREQPAR